MAKKNPYVTTIGFNKEDPDHVYVAEFLNSMGRGKGQYIVKAIMAYQNPGGVASGHGVVPAVDYEKIRDFVLHVLDEKVGMSRPDKADRSVESMQMINVQAVLDEKVVLPELDESAVNDILVSLSMFR